MSQKNEQRSRQCKVCLFYFPTTAKEIKDHAEKCQKKVDEEKRQREKR